MKSKCDTCGSFEIAFIYDAKTKREWPYYWHCGNCGSSVGCHPNTCIPLGPMATRSIRRKRSKVHSLFDPIWQNKYLTRADAYRWLAKVLELETDDCHIGQLSDDELRQAIIILTTHRDNDYSLFKRRKEKHVTKRIEQRQRESTKIHIRRNSKPKPFGTKAKAGY